MRRLWLFLLIVWRYDSYLYCPARRVPWRDAWMLAGVPWKRGTK